MTLEEAQAVASIVARADGGCDSCVSKLVGRLAARFPEFSWAIGENEAFDEEDEEWIGDDFDEGPVSIAVTVTVAAGSQGAVETSDGAR